MASEDQQSVANVAAGEDTQGEGDLASSGLDSDTGDEVDYREMELYEYKCHFRNISNYVRVAKQEVARDWQNAVLDGERYARMLSYLNGVLARVPARFVQLPRTPSRSRSRSRSHSPQPTRTTRSRSRSPTGQPQGIEDIGDENAIPPFPEPRVLFVDLATEEPSSPVYTPQPYDEEPFP